MPRRNHSKRRRRHIPESEKPSGKKRPRRFHHGVKQGDYYLEAEARFRLAEEGLA